MDKKREKREAENTPDEIDGITMKDQVLDDSFEPKVREYGGVSLQ